MRAQVKSPVQRIKDLEERVEELEAEMEGLKQEKAEEKKTAKGKLKFSDGILTVGGVKLRLGGKAEFLFIDSESEKDPVVGATAEPDPHLEVNRLRLEPHLIFNREVTMQGQIDFKPELRRTILKELTARHKIQPVWWFGSDMRIGLDDRFIRPARETKNYPLLGNAFWRDEEVALVWILTFGDKNGRPEDKKKEGGAKKSKGEKKAPGRQEAEGGPGTEEESGEPVEEGSQAPEPEEGTVVVKTPRGGNPFDFSKNLGELRTYFSLGNGYRLNNNQIGFDRAGFNDLIQDDRNVTADFSLRDLGLGLGYRRSFEWLGDAAAIAFYYNDELSDTSLQFLQQDLTLRDVVTGNPIGGYGDSNSRTSLRYGAGGEYFLPASTLWTSETGVRPNDGLRISGQWIHGRDGRLRRDGWYVQGAYRYSFYAPLLFDRYFRTVEPIARYGVLNTSLSPLPQLPATWDRRQILVGLLSEITKEILVKVEYTFNAEKTGGSGADPGPGKVDNDELMVELLMQF